MKQYNGFPDIVASFYFVNLRRERERKKGPTLPPIERKNDKIKSETIFSLFSKKFQTLIVLSAEPEIRNSLVIVRAKQLTVEVCPSKQAV